MLGHYLRIVKCMLHSDHEIVDSEHPDHGAQPPIHVKHVRMIVNVYVGYMNFKFGMAIYFANIFRDVVFN